MKSLTKALFSLALITGVSASATPKVSASGRLYLGSCGYYTSLKSDAWVRYANAELPWGSRVTLVWSRAGTRALGNGLNAPLSWIERLETEAVATEAHVWTAAIQSQLKSRGSSDDLWDLEFVFKITRPDGTEFYDNGSQGPWGFYRLSLRELYRQSPPGCYSDSAPSFGLGIRAIAN